MSGICSDTSSGAPTVLRRLVHLYVGLAMFGIGIALMVEARLGLSPWDVLHEGLAGRLGVGIGWVVIGVGALALVAWLPLGERPGLGTVSNVVVAGGVVNVALAAVPTPSSIAIRSAFLAAGIALVGLATALYVGARLGPGPRDGLMTGLARRGLSVRVARTAIELGVLGVGALLGGRVGPGTVAFAVVIGPIVHHLLPLLDLGDTTAERGPSQRQNDRRDEERCVYCAAA